MKSLHQRYEESVADKTLVPDAAQETAVLALDELFARLTVKKKFSLFKKEKALKGLYLFGSVGRGKTMLMDWFLQNLLIKKFKAERWHFHAFMLEIHQDLRNKIVSEKALENRVVKLADLWADRLQILCFDEFHITDVADAMIMMPLFTRLFERNVIVVSTSNWAPENLYDGGLQRQRFLPFIDILKTYMDVVNVNGVNDYRELKKDKMKSWLYPLNNDTEESFDINFRDAVGYDPIETHEIHVQGRSWVIPRASKNVALLDTDAILNQPLGAADFLALGERYNFLFLDNLLPFTDDEANKAKRFMVMIDALYDKNVRLAVRADVPGDKLYPTDGRLSFEFSRTLSRLKEMTQAHVKELLNS